MARSFVPLLGDKEITTFLVVAAIRARCLVVSLDKSKKTSYLSAFLEREREEYVRRLQAVREAGDFEGWITFFLVGVAQQAEAALRNAESLLRLNREFRERLRALRARGSVVDAAEGLIGNPFVTAPRLAETLGITRQGALYVISTLERAGIVAENAGGERSTLYVAREVLDVLEDETA